MLRISNIKLEVNQDENIFLSKAVIKKLKINQSDIKKIKIYKKSIDSRKKDNIKIIYTLDVEVFNEKKYLRYKDVSKAEQKYLRINKVNSEQRPIIVGSGPAGLFSALSMVDSGLKPIIVEMGKDVDARLSDIEDFRNNGVLNESSNIQFGAGGAGTFSDGKLTSGIKDPKKEYVMRKLIEFGAPKDIYYDQKPHVGTDILQNVVRNICDYLSENGCDIYFETKFINFNTKDNQISSITVLNDGKEHILETNTLVLAIGHSSRDTFKMLYENNINIKPKPFAVGLRIEHKREDINISQFGKYAKHLPTANYKLTYNTLDKRGVYTFCMCPGGEVVAASSSNGKLCTNGMSYRARDLENSNSAILVTIKPEDYMQDDNPLSGMFFQEQLETKAFELGGSNYNAPIQKLGDYFNNSISKELGSIIPSYTPGYKFANLNELFPSFINDSLHEAFRAYQNKIEEFKNLDAILTGVESRSSSPITIIRDENLNSNISGIYPVGEGAGYAGGIVSAACDGIKASLEIINKLSN